MPYKISFLEEAENDIDEAFLWYEIKQVDLGFVFYENIEKGINYISEHPRSCLEIYRNTRRFILNKFPYGIYYQVDDFLKEIKIVGVIHFKRRIKKIKERIKK